MLSALPDGEREAFMDALTRLVGGRLAEPVECARPCGAARLARRRDGPDYARP